jgi:ribosomal protein S6
MKSKTALTFQAQNAKEKENTFKKLTYEIKKHIEIIYDSVKIKCQMLMHVVDIHQRNINEVRMCVTI